MGHDYELSDSGSEHSGSNNSLDSFDTGGPDGLPLPALGSGSDLRSIEERPDVEQRMRSSIRDIYGNRVGPGLGSSADAAAAAAGAEEAVPPPLEPASGPVTGPLQFQGFVRAPPTSQRPASRELSMAWFCLRRRRRRKAGDIHAALLFMFLCRQVANADAMAANAQKKGGANMKVLRTSNDSPLHDVDVEGEGGCFSCTRPCWQYPCVDSCGSGGFLRCCSPLFFLFVRAPDNLCLHPVQVGG